MFFNNYQKKVQHFNRNNHWKEMILTRTKPEPEKAIENIDTTIYEIPDPPKIEIGDPLLNI